MLATFSHLVPRFVCKFSLNIFDEPNDCIVAVLCCTWAGILTFLSRTTTCPINRHFFPPYRYGQQFGISWWQMTHPLLQVRIHDKFTYLPSNSTTCLCSLNCTFSQVIISKSNFIALLSFYTLAICVSWAALNWTRVGQYCCWKCTMSIILYAFEIHFMSDIRIREDDQRTPYSFLDIYVLHLWFLYWNLRVHFTTRI